MQDPLGLLTTDNAPTDDPLGLMVSEEPRISQAPEPTFWEKAGGKIKDFLNPHAPGQMAPADVADAQIRLEARKKGLTKEAYTRQVNPDGELNRRVTRTGKNIIAGAVSTAEGMAGGFEWLTNGAMGQDLANNAKLWAQDLTPEEHDFSDAVASGIGSTATFFIPGMGITKGAGALAKITPRLASWLGVATATSMEAMTEAGQVYRDVLNKTKDEGKAGSAATKTFWGNIPLLAITNKLGIYGEKGTQAKRTLTSMAMEGAQEGGQEAISEKASGDPLNLLNIAESAGVGAVTGGLFSLRGGHDVANAPSETTPGTGTTPGGGKEAPATPPPSGNKHENMIQQIKDILAEGDENKQAYIEQQKAKPETPAPEQAPAPVKEVTPETVPTPEEQATRNIVLPLPEYSTTNGWKRETIQALNDGRDPINAAANWYRDEGKMYGGEKRLTQRVNSFIGEWKKQNQTPTPTPEAAEITAAANEAATSPQNDTPEPTPAQIEAGNYKKGHVNFNGLDITIENPAGSTRKGVDEHGNEWETELVHHYGYIKGTTGKDGDHVDIFMPEDIGPNNNKVFVVDQKDNVTGNFDEHKVMLGFDSLKNAREGYLDNYDESGPDRIMNITEMSVDDFKDWLKNGSQNKPAVSYFKAPAKRTADDTNKTENVDSSASSQAETAPVKDYAAFYKDLDITTEPETMNLVLHEMRSVLKEGSPGGKQGTDEDGNPVYAKSGYPDWFTDLVKEYGNKKTSRTGERESVSAADLINVIDKGLKGDKLTSRQYRFWEDVNRIADRESGRTYAGLVNAFERVREYEERTRREAADAGFDPERIEAYQREGVENLRIERDWNPEEEGLVRQTYNDVLSEYLHHATAAEHLQSIKIEGLDPEKSGSYIYGEDTSKRIYLSPGKDFALNYGDILLRAKRSDLKPDFLDEINRTGGIESWYFEKIPPEQLEIYINGNWEPLLFKTEKTKAGEQATIPGTSEAENFGLDNPETDMSKHKPLPEQVTPKNADLFENERGAIDLHILGVPQIVNATRKLIQKIDPKAARNIAVQTNKEDKLGFVKGVIGSPSAIIGKAQYYVIHAKNAMLKQERLRGIVKDKTGKIFNSLSKEQAKEFENLLWLGDADGKNYTEADLDEMDVSLEVKAAYLAQRKFHDQVWRMMKVHRKAYGMDVSGMEGVKGHIPHLFENWNVYEMVEEEVEGKDGETEIITVPGPIAGTFRSLKEATEFANTLNPNIEYLIKPKAFRMPDDVIAKTVLKDSSYFKMVEKVEKEFQLTKDEAHEIVGNVARLKGRHRILGNLMKREGQTGFRKDNIRDILTEYYNSAARYIAMDDFKARVVPKFEKDFGIELGRADQAIRDKNTARYVQEYINDINGVPGMIEDMMNAAIMKHPFFANRVSSQRPAVWAINKAMHVTAVCKLGLLNLSSGIVNLAQLTNTFAILPTKEFSYAFGKVISGRLSSSEKRMLKRLGIEYDLGLTDTGGYSAIHKGGKIVDASLFFFRKAEYLNRAISGVAAYHTALKQGMNKADARAFARKTIDRTQFDYSVADTARIFRNPVGRFAGQFKPYAIKQIEFIAGLKGAEHAKFWIPMLLMAGTAGIPMIEGLVELIEWLTGTNPLTETKEFLMEWAADDNNKKAVARVAMYGVASMLNVDVSRRIGTGDIIPKRTTDLLGPTISTVLGITKAPNATTAVKAMAPSIGNLLTAIEIARNDMTVTDPYHRDREKFKASGSDLVAKAAGFRSVRESEFSDAQNIANYEKEKYTKLQQKYVDKAIEALKSGDAKGFTEAITKAAEKGVIVDSDAIKREFINKLLPQDIRMIRNSRKAQREDAVKLSNYLADEEDYEYEKDEEE